MTDGGLIEVPKRTHQVSNGKYASSLEISQRTFDKKCIDIHKGQRKAPQALQNCCCYKVAGQKNK